MSNITEILDKINADMTNYKVILYGNAKSEDGRDNVQGYAALNTLTDTIEMTSTMLPNVIYQTQHLDSMLTSMIAPKKEKPSLSLAEFPEDVVPN